MRTIDEVIHDSQQAEAAEKEYEMQKNKPVSQAFIQRQLPAWKRWYLKKNQPRNYLRVTRIVLPGTEENKNQWKQKFQIWVKGNLREEYIINADTYEFYESLWGKEEIGGMCYAVYRSPAQLSET